MVVLPLPVPPGHHLPPRLCHPVQLESKPI